MYVIFCIHSSVEGHLYCFYLLAIITRAAMNLVEQVSLLYAGTSLGICLGVVYLGPQLVCLRVLVSVKRNHDQGNSYQGQHLIGTGLQVYCFTPTLSWWEQYKINSGMNQPDLIVLHIPLKIV